MEEPLDLLCMVSKGRRMSNWKKLQESRFAFSRNINVILLTILHIILIIKIKKIKPLYEVEYCSLKFSSTRFMTTLKIILRKIFLEQESSYMRFIHSSIQ